MFLKVLGHLATIHEAIRICYPESNKGFAAALAPFASARVVLTPIPFTRVSAELFRAPFRRRYRAYVDRVIDEFKPDVALVLQGRIENVAAPVLTLKSRGVRLVSYLPMAHSCIEIGSKFAATGVPDLLRRFYYAQPDRFIVPSRAVAAQVDRAGGKAAVVAENVVAITPSPLDKTQARAELGLPSDRRLAVIFGRLKTRHKGLDRLVNLLSAQRARLADWRFAFIGDGEGAQALREAVAREGLNDQVTFMPWCGRPDLVYASADILLMPSRYEGVPLVMLEAFTCGTPLLGSEIDVCEEYLPPSHRFSFEPPDDLASAMDRALGAEGRAAYDAARKAHLARLDLAETQRRFAAGLEST